MSELEDPTASIYLQQEFAFIRNILSTKEDPLIELKLGEAFLQKERVPLGYATLIASTIIFNG